jgi:hypothetical protein
MLPRLPLLTLLLCVLALAACETASNDEGDFAHAGTNGECIEVARK